MFLGVESRTWKGARVQAYAGQVEQVIEAGFGESLGRSLELLLWLAGTEAARLAHAELEGLRVSTCLGESGFTRPVSVFGCGDPRRW
jgi:hypothetical protein